MSVSQTSPLIDCWTFSVKRSFVPVICIPAGHIRQWKRSNSESLFTFYASLTCPYRKSSHGIKYHLWLRLVTFHPRRPRGSQSGREKRRDKSFQAQPEKPLGTDSHRTISKRSSDCWLLIGHKNALYSLCPIGEWHLLSSSCTKEMHAVSQFDIKATFQNTGSLYTKPK